MTLPYFIDTAEKAEVFKRWLGNQRTALAFDTETTGLAWDARVRLVQFGDTTGGWAIPWETHEPLVREVFDRYEGRFTAHNAGFDFHRLENSGLKLDDVKERTTDTLIVASILDPAARSQQLKPLGVKYLGDYADDLRQAKDQLFRGPSLEVLTRQLKEEQPGLLVREARELAREIQPTLQYDWATVPIDAREYVEYGIYDTVLTAQLLDLMSRNLSPNDRFVNDKEHQVQRVLWRMEARGLLIDHPYAVSLDEEWQAQIDWVRYSIAERYGVTDPGKQGQLLTAFMSGGWRPTVFTPTGLPSLKGEVLEEIDHPLADAVSTLKRMEKWRSAYVGNILAGLDAEGRIHPTINGSRARTGRMSIKDPPMQQLPKSDPTIRRMIRAAEGQALISIDYEQVEMRVAASLSREVLMLDAIRAGADLHTETARTVYGGEPTPEQRQLGKGGNFAVLYGSGYKRLAEQVGVSTDVAKHFFDTFHNRYSSMHAWTKANEATAKKQGYVTTAIYGRRLPVDPGQWYAATNYVVQGTATEVLKEAILDLSRSGLDEYMLLPVHDEVLFMAPEHEAEGVMEEAAAIMTNTDFSGVVLEADGEVLGHTWGKD